VFVTCHLSIEKLDETFKSLIGAKILEDSRTIREQLGLRSTASAVDLNLSFVKSWPWKWGFQSLFQDKDGTICILQIEQDDDKDDDRNKNKNKLLELMKNGLGKQVHFQKLAVTGRVKMSE
jgi:hypothetical protein